jgi:hypothetical protein
MRGATPWKLLGVRCVPCQLAHFHFDRCSGSSAAFQRLMAAHTGRYRTRDLRQSGSDLSLVCSVCRQPLESGEPTSAHPLLGWITWRVGVGSRLGPPGQFASPRRHCHDHLCGRRLLRVRTRVNDHPAAAAPRTNQVPPVNRYDSIAALDLSAYTLVLSVSLALQQFNAPSVGA